MRRSHFTMAEDISCQIRAIEQNISVSEVEEKIRITEGKLEQSEPESKAWEGLSKREDHLLKKEEQSAPQRKRAITRTTAPRRYNFTKK